MWGRECCGCVCRQVTGSGTCTCPAFQLQKEGRKGWESQCSTMERRGEGLSPGNQENLKRKSKLQNRKQPPRPENIIPQQRDCLWSGHEARSSVGWPSQHLVSHLEDPESQSSTDNCSATFGWAKERGRLEEEFSYCRLVFNGKMDFI